MSRLIRLCISGATAILLPAAALVPAHAADPDAPDTLVPIGGGYTTESLEGFAGQVIEQATGETVDIYVIPSSYGDAPEDREENLELAGERADQIGDACNAVVDLAVFPGGCRSTLLPLLARADALDPANSQMLADPETDGVYVLGGDQVLAMQVLANSPAEANLEIGFRHGVVVGGTSAGNAVESRTMGAGYPDEGYPWNALERDMSLVFWGDDLASDERGLSFGSEEIILDQHFYQRGRFGRLLSWVGQSVDRYGGDGKLGVGVDWGTGVVIEDDRLLTDPFGFTSSAVVDMSRSTDLGWVGPRDTLSVHDVLTHLMAPGTGITYDAVTREVMVDGQVLAPSDRATVPQLTTGGAPLWLGGGENADAASPVVAEFLDAVEATRRGANKGGGTILLVTAGYADEGEATEAAADYQAALTGAGWRGQVRVLEADALTQRDVATARGLLLIGGDQALMGGATAPRTGSLLDWTVGRVPVLTDGAATAVMGERYACSPGPTSRDYEDWAMAQMTVDGTQWCDGLGVLPGWTVEPMLTYDYRWGRLYAGARQDPALVSLGISELTAVRVDAGAAVTGERSAVVVDGRDAQWIDGGNGAIGAVNVWMDVHGPGDEVD